MEYGTEFLYLYTNNTKNIHYGGNSEETVPY